MHARRTGLTAKSENYSGASTRFMPGVEKINHASTRVMLVVEKKKNASRTGVIAEGETCSKPSIGVMLVVENNKCVEDWTHR